MLHAFFINNFYKQQIENWDLIWNSNNLKYQKESKEK